MSIDNATKMNRLGPMKATPKQVKIQINTEIPYDRLLRNKSNKNPSSGYAFSEKFGFQVINKKKQCDNYSEEKLFDKKFMSPLVQNKGLNHFSNDQYDLKYNNKDSLYLMKHDLKIARYEHTLVEAREQDVQDYLLPHFVADSYI